MKLDALMCRFVDDEAKRTALEVPTPAPAPTTLPVGPETVPGATGVMTDRQIDGRRESDDDTV